MATSLRAKFHGTFVRTIIIGALCVVNSTAASWVNLSSASTTADSWYTYYANGYIYASATTGTVRSTDGITWSPAGTGITPKLMFGIGYANSIYVMAGGANDGSAGVLMSSSDGINWTSRGTNAASYWSLGSDGNGNFLAGLSADGGLSYSSNGTTWTSVSSDPASGLQIFGIAYGGWRWVAVAYPGLASTTPGTFALVSDVNSHTVWTKRTISTDGSMMWGVAYGNGLFVAVGDAERIYTSADGSTWTNHTISPKIVQSFTGVAFGGGEFVAIGSDGIIYSSTNGTSWTPEASTTSETIWAVTYGNNAFVFVDNAGKCYVRRLLPTVTAIGPSSGSTLGATSVTITGTNFTNVTAVKFGTANVNSYTVNSTTQITATSPAGSAGTVDVTMTTAGGTSVTGSVDRYTYVYVAPPTVTSVSPTSVPTAGGTSATSSADQFTYIAAPTVTTQAVSNITNTAATGNCNINSLGVPNPTQYGVVWSTSTGPTVALPTKTGQGAATITGPFSCAIAGLLPNTTYYVKAYATNAACTSYGTEVSFKTPLTKFTLTTNATNGSITKNPSTTSYDSSTVVQVTAVPDAGYSFTGWTDDLTGSTNPSPITMDANKTVTANFAINTYNLTLTAGTGGSITAPATTLLLLIMAQ
jgi:uncharacterized repeat protein (TIGR02543 family)